MILFGLHSSERIQLRIGYSAKYFIMENEMGLALLEKGIGVLMGRYVIIFLLELLHSLFDSVLGLALGFTFRIQF